jgi:hypothetical protein
MAKKLEKNDSYRVGKKAGAIIRASVDVGLGQDGFVKMSLDRKAIIGTAAPIGLLAVGTAAEVKEKLLVVQSKVTDVSVMTNRMSVAIRLTGGPSPKTITVPAEVTDQGDSILIEVFVLFRE